MMLRDQFPIFEHTHFINSCSKGALSLSVKAAYERYLEDWAVQGSPWELWVTQLEIFRSKVATLIHADPDEIAIKTSVSDAVNALASALDFSGERNKIIVDEYAFPTTAQIWHAQAKYGAKVVHIRETEDHQLPLSYYESVIDEQTLLVSLTQICYRHGGRQAEVEAIVKLAHEHGALVLLDSFQGLGTFPIDVTALDIDFLVGGTLKYLLGSSGLAFLYAKQAHTLSHSPSATGWFAQADIFAMDINAHVPAPSARRFESGTPPNPNIYAGIAGLDIISGIGINAIEIQINTITDTIKQRANDAGYKIATPAQHGAMVAIQCHDVEALVTALATENVIVSSRDGNLRISPHFYNDLSDVDALFAGLTKYRQFVTG